LCWRGAIAMSERVHAYAPLASSHRACRPRPRCPAACCGCTKSSTTAAGHHPQGRRTGEALQPIGLMA
jgi:hypothetical protein